MAAVERFERGIRLAKLLGRGGENEVEIWGDQILATLHKEGLSTRLAAGLLKLIREVRIGDPDELKSLAGRFVHDAHKAGNLHDAIEILDVRASLEAAQKDHASQAKTLAEKAATLVAIGRRMSPASASASWIERAIAIYRQIGTVDKVEALTKELLDIQRRATEELGEISVEVDLSQEVTSARQAVEGQPWPDALFGLSIIAPLIDPDDMRARVMETRKNHPLLSMLSWVQMDHTGRPTHRQPSPLEAEGEDEDPAMFGQMCREADFVRQVMVPGRILPAMRVVAEEHMPRARDLVALLRHSPFVPEGREISFARGLAAGFEGDWMLATYFLLPQLENSLRAIIEAKGITVRTIDPDGPQEYFSLSRTLRKVEVQEVFGPILSFELRSLLSESAGDNLRNEALHGLLPDGYLMGSHTMPYLWWLTLRICFLPLFAPASADEEAEENTGDQEDEAD